MNIRGLQKVSLVDFPGGICSTVFVGGCNLKCRYCYNRDLVLDSDNIPEIITREIFDFLRHKSSLLDGVCITGGEPALQNDIFEFIAKIKKMGLKVKLDSNGTRPKVIGKLLEENVLDYVAVDIKGPFSKYSLIAGTSVDLSKLKETIALLKSSSIEYEFRTTVIPGLLKEEDIVSIAKEIAGCRCYVLQQFSPRPTIIDPGLLRFQPYSRERVAAMAESCREHVETVKLRGF